ncbi:hypothetical protein COCNU_07G009930 [Cocos nucifera]|uniref:Uncharacterized protein n=1 Tax=Cocos nucifera TaxID=13894 RepID=A0A8K0IFH1_COCNU|nr:hypothetical protein COCNU_07G009930 [Cocos nucifera]
MSVGAPPTIEELDDDVMVVKAPAVFVKLTISRAPSMPKGKAPMLVATSWTLSSSESINIQVLLGESALANLVLEKQLVEVAHDMLELDRFIYNFIDICQRWVDKAKSAIVEKNAALQHLQVASDKLKMMEE